MDSTVIALWLGHADVRSTTPYIHADMRNKERALALVTPASVTPGRYKLPDTFSRSSRSGLKLHKKLPKAGIGFCFW